MEYSLMEHSSLNRKFRVLTVNMNVFEMLSGEERPTPKGIHEVLNQHVIKQEQAKKALALALHNHYKILNYNDPLLLLGDALPALPREQKLQRNITLLIGDTGTGKSHMVKTLAEASGLPSLTLDMLRISPNAYEGSNIVSEFKRFLAKAEYNVKLAEYGILFIDEFDKIRRNPENKHAGTYKEMIQQELLSIFEGEPLKIPLYDEKITATSATTIFNTDKLLIICSGAFVGLDKVMENRRKKLTSGGVKKLIGFSSTSEESKAATTSPPDKVEAADLEEYGLIPELFGRISTVVKLDTLLKEDLVRILTEPKDNLVGRHKLSFALDRILLDFSEESLHTIAEQALAKKVGARGLRGVLEELLGDILYDVIGTDVVQVTVKGDLTTTRIYDKKELSL